MRFRNLALVGALFMLASACEAPKPPQPASLEDGDRCFEGRNWNCAAANYNGYLKTYPNDPAVNARLAIARTRAVHHKEAVPFYAHAESLGVMTYDLFANYAVSLDATGDLDGAIRANLRALEIVPRLVDVRGSLASQLVRKGQPQDAIDLLEEFDAYLKRQGEAPYFTAQIASIKEKMATGRARPRRSPIHGRRKVRPVRRIGWAEPHCEPARRAAATGWPTARQSPLAKAGQPARCSFGVTEISCVNPHPFAGPGASHGHRAHAIARRQPDQGRNKPMEVMIPIAFFAMIAAIVIVPTWLKSRERGEMQATLRSAIDRGQPVPQEVIDAMTRNVKIAPTALSDLRTGIIWIAVGIGFGVFGYFVSYEADGAFHPMIGVATIPAIIGLTYVVLSFFNPNKSKQP